MSTSRLKRKRSPVPHLAPWILERIRASISVKQLLLEDQDYLDTVSKAGQFMAQTLAQVGNNFLRGTGGSATDTQHLAAEFTGCFLKEHRPLAGIGLPTNTSAPTAIANDYSYDEVFSRQLEGLSRTGDVVVGISTSGNSPNFLCAMEAARRIGFGTIALTGKNRGGNSPPRQNIAFAFFPAKHLGYRKPTS